MELDTIAITVRHGFPLVAHVVWQPAEPDVGIFNRYFEVARVTLPDGRSADFLNLTDEELDAAIEEALL